MRRLGALFFVLVTVGNVLSQGPIANAPQSSGGGRVVRVQQGYSCGWCAGFGYHTQITTIEPSFIVWEGKETMDKKNLPNRRVKRPISKREWQTLLRSIDADALKAVPQQSGCRSCVDQAESWLMVQYSDGSKISVSYGPMSEPAPVKALKFPALQITFNAPVNAAKKITSP